MPRRQHRILRFRRRPAPSRPTAETLRLEPFSTTCRWWSWVWSEESSPSTRNSERRTQSKSQDRSGDLSGLRPESAARRPPRIICDFAPLFRSGLCGRSRLQRASSMQDVGATNSTPGPGRLDSLSKNDGPRLGAYRLHRACDSRSEARSPLGSPIRSSLNRDHGLRGPAEYAGAVDASTWRRGASLRVLTDRPRLRAGESPLRSARIRPPDETLRSRQLPRARVSSSA